MHNTFKLFEREGDDYEDKHKINPYAYACARSTVCDRGGVAAAATPSAIWNGFDSLKGSYELTVDSSCSIENGVVTIGSSGGITIAYPTKNPFTVIAEVSDCPDGTVTIFSGRFNNNNADADIRLVSTGTSLKHVWTDQTTDYGSTSDWDRGRHTLTMAYQSGENTYIDGVKKFTGNAASSAYQITRIFIGMRCKNNGNISQVATGMKVYRVAIFESKLSDTDVAAFKWPTKWVGGEGNWSDATKWEGGEVPTSGLVEIPAGAIVNVDANANPAGVTICGSGTIVYDGKLPGNEKTSYQATAWTGTVWVKNYNGNECSHTLYGNALSTVRFTNVTGWLATAMEFGGTFDLVDEGSNVAYTQNNGSSGWNANRDIIFSRVTGSGTFKSTWNNSNGVPVIFRNVSGFDGSINLVYNCAGVLIGETVAYNATGAGKGIIYLDSGATATISSGKSWTASSGITINGTLCGVGTLASATTLNEGAKLKPTNGGLKITAALTAPSGITIDASDMVTNDELMLPLVTLNSEASAYTVNIENAPTGYGEFINGNVIYLAKTAAIATDAASFKAKYEVGGDIILGADIDLGELYVSANKDEPVIYTCGHSLTGGTLDNCGGFVTFKVEGTFHFGSTLVGTGKFVKDGDGYLAHYCNATLIKGATVEIRNGRYCIGNGTTELNLENPAFIIGENGSLENYGWVNITGTLTVDTEFNTEVFTNTNLPTGTGYKTAVLQGSPKLVKSGSGELSMGIACEALSGLTINGGSLLITSAGNGEHPALSFADNATFALPEGGMTDNLITKVTGTGALNGTTHIANIKIGNVDTLVTLVFDSSAKTVSYVLPAKAKLSETALDWSDTGTWEGGAVPTSGLVEIPAGAIVNVDIDVSSCTINGAGTIVYDNKLPGNEKTCYQANTWTGTVWIKNYKPSSLQEWTSLINTWGNIDSKVKFTSIAKIYTYNVTIQPEIVLADENNEPAFKIEAGGGGYVTTYRKLSGSGTFQNNYANAQRFNFLDVSDFTGSFNDVNGKYFEIGDGSDCSTQKKLVIDAEYAANIAEGATWTFASGIQVKGTLSGQGTAAANVAFDAGSAFKVTTAGKLTVNGNVTGTVEIDATALVEAGLNGAIAMTVSGTKSETVTCSTAGYEAYWNGNDLVVVKSAAKEFYSKWGNAQGVFTWRSANNCDLASEKSTFKKFDAILLNDTGDDIHGTGLYNNETFWHYFAHSSSVAGYTAPGCVIRFVDGYGKSIGGSYSALALYGLIVEQGAGGYSFTDSGSARRTVLGNPFSDSELEAYFSIGANFTFARNGQMLIAGTTTFDVAQGCVLDLNSTQGDSCQPVIIQSVAEQYNGALNNPVAGGKLILKGEGQIKMKTLTASNATLDYSNLDFERTTPFITGNLTIDANTKLIFPAEFEPTSENPDSAFQLCSGTLTAPDGLYKITVGEKTDFAALTFTGNKVSYAWKKAEVTITEDLTWDKLTKLDGYIDGAPITINLGADVTIDFTETVSTAPLTFKGEHTVTLAYTKTPTIREIKLEDGAIYAIKIPATSDFPTATALTIPAGMTYTICGPETETAKVWAGVITVNGSLKTEGKLTLSGANVVDGGALEVVNGEVTYTSADQGVKNGGMITIDVGATMIANTTDTFSYANDARFTLNVYGTLNMSTKRWTIKGSGAALNLYAGSTINGTGDGNGAIDTWVGLNVMAMEGESVVTINCPINYSAANKNFLVEAGVTLELTSARGANGNAFIKTGDGTLKILVDQNNALTINAGKVILSAESYTNTKWISGAGAVEVVSGNCVTPFADGFTGTKTLTDGTLTLEAGKEGAVAVNGGTLKLKLTEAQVATGYTAEEVTLGQGVTGITFVKPDGTEVPVIGKHIDGEGKKWIGGTDNNWSTGTNWEGGTAPTAQMAAIIDKEASIIVVSTDVCHSLVIRESAALSGDLSGLGVIAVDASKTLTIDLNSGCTFNAGQIEGTGSVIMKGSGVAVFEGKLPPATCTFDATWTGTAWLKNKTGLTNINFNNYGNANSTVRCSGISGYMQGISSGAEFGGTIELVNDSYQYGLNLHDGSSGDAYVWTFDHLKGNGKLLCDGGSTAGFLVKDWSEFSGEVELDKKALTFGTVKKAGNDNEAKVFVNSGATVTLQGQSWKATNGIKIDGTIGGHGTLISPMTLNGTLNATDEELLTLQASPTINLCAMVVVAEFPTDDLPATILKIGENATGFTDEAVLCDKIIAKKSDGTIGETYFKAVVDMDSQRIILAPSNATDEDRTTPIVNATTLETPISRFNGTETLTGVGGVKSTSMFLGSKATLQIDPIKTPLLITSGTPVLMSGATIELVNYSACALGKFVLATWTGEQISTTGLVATGFASEEYTLTCEATANGQWQLVLKVGDYDNQATSIKVMPLGDSITEGTNQYEDFARPNYRIPLMKKLAANGFAVESLGYQKSCNADSAGVQADPKYEWHCGMSGQMCRTKGAAGWEDSIDVALDMAGEPDIVTFKIGTNDLRGGVGNADTLFEAWSNVVWKILKVRPATRIVCGAVIDSRDDPTYNTTKVVAFNTKIADFIEHGNFPAGRVYFADLNAACPPRDSAGTDNGNLADNLHPTWTGHDKVSDCWLAKIKEVMAIPFTPAASISYTTTTAIEDNVPEGYYKNFVKLASYTPTATKKHTVGTALTADDYTYFNSEKADTVFAKVGYYVVLKRKDTDLVDYHDHVRFLWVDMATFGDGKIADFGVPTAKKNQQVVNALHVYSNDTGIRSIEPTDNSAQGFVEFWPYSYSGDASSIAGAPANLYNCDWNDSTDNSGSYGSMQVHRIFKQGESWNAGEVLFAYNRWTSNNNNEIGIGSFAQKMSSTSIDYTFTSGLGKADASAYEIMSIDIYGIEKTETTWTGTKDNNWNDAENWDFGVPTEVSDVIIPADAEIELNDDVTIVSLTITDASASITGTGSIKVTNLATSTLKGEATIVFDGALPSEAVRVQLQASDWKGTAILKGISTSDDFHPEYYGNANSIVTFCGITPACLPESGTFDGEIKLVNNGTTDAWTMGDGYSRDTTGYVIAKLSGDGNFTDTNSSVTQQITINDGSTFTGNLTIAGKRWVFGTTAVTGEASKKRITVQNGQKIKFAGQTWSATNGVFFEATVKVVGDIGDYITMQAPSSIPGIITDEGNASDDLALKYEDGKLKIVAAGAKTDDGKSYETIEQAINANNGATITIAKDTELNIGALTATFKLDQTSLAKYKIGWTDGEKYLACNSEGVLTVKTGEPKGEFSSFECYALGIDAETEAVPKTDVPADNGDEDTMTVEVKSMPRKIAGKKVVYQAFIGETQHGEDVVFDGENAPTIQLAVPSTGEVIYTIKVAVEEDSAN